MPTPMQQYKAGPLTFIVRHELWDGNIQDHADQGVSIVVAAKVEGKHTVLLRFNCLDIEKSYEYGPEKVGMALIRTRHRYRIPGYLATSFVMLVIMQGMKHEDSQIQRRRLGKLRSRRG